MLESIIYVCYNLYKIKIIERENYEVPESLRLNFYESVKRYLPWIQLENLQPAYAGIRPKLHGPNETFADFLIQTEAEHGMKGLVNLLGIESPGITASLAIAKRVVELADSKN